MFCLTACALLDAHRDTGTQAHMCVHAHTHTGGGHDEALLLGVARAAVSARGRRAAHRGGRKAGAYGHPALAAHVPGVHVSVCVCVCVRVC